MLTKLKQKIASNAVAPSAKPALVAGIKHFGTPAEYGRKLAADMGEPKQKSSGKARLSDQITFGLLWILLALMFFITTVMAVMTSGQWSILAMGAIALLAVTAGIIQTVKSNRLQTLHRQQSSELFHELESLQDQTWELKESEERYRSLADAFGDMTMHRLSNGEITYVNEIFANAFGQSPDYFVGKTFTPVFLEESGNLECKGNSSIREVRINTLNGERWFAWLDLPVRDEATGESSLRTMARDITHQKETEIDLRGANERTSAASHAKSRFLANVSHEMRTPLNGILGMSGLLADTKLTAEQKNYVEAVHESGKALLTLIEDILDMTIVEAGRLELKASEVDPARLSEDVCELLASRAHAKSISITSCIGADVPAAIHVDGGRLRQVLINLVGNALKFTESGGVLLKVNQTAVPEKSFSRLLFSVQDTGPGISQKDQRLIFEEFAQADSKSTRAHGGAGLGLAISRRIINQMNGEINLISKIGQGSTFSFEIEVPVAIQNRKQQVEKPGKVIALAGGSLFERETIETYVKEASGVLLSGMSGDELQQDVQNTSAQKAEVVLIDQSVMPDVISSEKLLQDTGNPAMRMIILLEPKQRSKVDEYLKNGFDGYLIKPVRKTSFLNIVMHNREVQAGDQNHSSLDDWNPASKEQTSSKRILLAEDNDINALLARSILEKHGHTVTRAENGSEAISLWAERLKTEPFDLVFMDLQMPVMDGLDAVSEIRKQEKTRGTTPLPIFILTADEQEETRQKADQQGANGLLTKPLDPAKLVELTASV